MAENMVFKIADILIEAIAVAISKNCMFITQLKAHYRNMPMIDACANNTTTMGYPESLFFAIEQKREYRNQWFETKIYYRKFEFLVTGCLKNDFEKQPNNVMNIGDKEEKWLFKSK